MMADADKWTKWLLERRSGGNQQNFESLMATLVPVRDAIISSARIAPEDRVLDVGTGDGLLAFEALKAISEKGSVVFSDISQSNLEFCKSYFADEVPHNVEFIRTDVTDLAEISDASVDVIICRAVLTYCEDRQSAFRSFHRVLRKGGRVSLSEPINSFANQKRKRSGANVLLGYDLTPLGEIGTRIATAYREAMATTGEVMVTFDERDLFDAAEDAGFTRVSLEYNAVMNSKRRFPNWDYALNSAPNPNSPTLAEILAAVFNSQEQMAFEEYFRPLIETQPRKNYAAQCYLVSEKA